MTLRWLTCAGALFVTAAATAVDIASPPSCRSQVEVARIGTPTKLVIPAGGSAESTAALPRGHRVLILATEQRVDLLLEAGAESGEPTVRADTPYRRQGTIHAIYNVADDRRLRVKLSVKEHPLASGTATVELFDLDALPQRTSCAAVFQMMAAGDADYSVGVDVSTGRRMHPGLVAKHAFLRATEEYLVAYGAAATAEDAGARMLAALSLAATYIQGVKDWRRTREWGSRAHELACRAGDSYASARADYVEALGWIDSPGPPVVAKDSGEIDAHTRLKSVRKSLRAIEQFHRRRGETYDAANALNAVGQTYATEGEYAEAIKALSAAAHAFHTLAEPAREGSSVGGVAWNEWGLGNLGEAERHFRKGIDLSRSDPYAYIGGMTSLANLEQEMGHLDTALELQTQALELAERFQFRIRIGQGFYSLGATYYALGDIDQSIYYLEHAVDLSREDPYARAIDLRALGAAYRDAGRYEDARKSTEAALALAVSRPARARIEMAIATDDAALGHVPEALNRLAAVLSGPANGLRDVRAEALTTRAQILRSAGRASEAVNDLGTALALLQGVEALDDLFLANLELARAQLALGRLSDANAAADRALDLGHYLRQQSANPELRAQRQDPIRRAYEVKVAVTMAMRREMLARGDTAAARAKELDALITVESSRAQALRDFSAVDYSHTGGSSGERDLARRAELYRELGFRLEQLGRRTDNTGEQDPSVVQTLAGVSVLRRKLDAVNGRIAARTGNAGPDARPVPGGWTQWLAAHAPDSVILEYWLGEQSAYCWVIGPAGIQFVELGDSRAIDAAARAMHAAMRAPQYVPVHTRIDTTMRLSRLILEPIGHIAPLTRRLIIVPDQALAYVAFPALVESGSIEPNYLIQSHEIAMVPAAWWFFRPIARRNEHADGGILIVADPIYQADDERRGAQARIPAASNPTAARASDRLSRLEMTHREATAIAGLFPASAVRRLEGLAATRAQLLAEPLDRYRYIHIASHGTVDSGMPQMDSLVLSEYDANGPIREPRVSTADLMTLDLQAEVVALSACDTARGKGAVGEGAMGLGYAALARGAHSVLASLWPVTDEISADVMTEFYRGLREHHTRPATALADSMRGVLKKRPDLDPAYWAAYQLTLSDAWDTARDESRNE